MESWANFWGAVLIASFILLAVLTVIVTIGGARDIKSLLATLERKRQDAEAEPTAESKESG